MSHTPVIEASPKSLSLRGGRLDHERPDHERSDHGGQRDRAIDVVRAVAIAGVVVGHWVVTGIVLGADGGLRQASPLAAMPWMAPLTWVLQTLGLFFFAGGYAAARPQARARSPLSGRVPQWVGRRLGRLVGPVAGFCALWMVALLAAAVAGAPEATLRTAGKLAFSPLWFLLPFTALIALTGPARWAVARVGPIAALPAVAVVALADAGTGWLPLTLVAAWLVPYLLGVALATGRLSGRHTGLTLIAGGAATLAFLVLVLDYPASAVGVPGDGRSNLSPPSLFAVALATAQIGVVLLIRPWLNRQPLPRAVTLLNRAAMPIYLWHQTAFVAVTAGALWVSSGVPVPGLHTPPDGLDWAATRMVWLPAFAAVLVVACRLAGQRTPTGRPTTTTERPGCTMADGSEPGRPTEVIAVRDSDPPSHSRATRQPR